MRYSTLSSALATILATASMGLAATIHVPADQPTIQAGIDAAVNGDTVLVADGTYTGDGNWDIDFEGKAILVTSENGPEITNIDCEGSEWNPHRAFYFHSMEDTLSILSGLTIMNGYAPGERPVGCGGGIRCENYSSPTINNCVIRENTAGDLGGGIYCDTGAAPIIRGCLISNNSAIESGGGGIATFTDGKPFIVDCIIRDNTATSWGGGVYYYTLTSPQILRSLIINNEAGSDGGGAVYSGGAILEIRNCTISGNQDNWDGGAIWGNYGTFISVKNSILWNNDNNEIYINEGYGTIEVSYSDITGGWIGEGNMNEDPLFVAPFDYHLTWGSPCIDTGDPASPPDPDGTRTDMGAYYYIQGPLSEISIVVVPDITQCTKGDSLGCTAYVWNNTDTTIFIQGWTEGETPWGLILSPLLGPINVVLASHQHVSSHITQYIPMNTPYGGPYFYRVIVGNYPDEVISEDSFEFFVGPVSLTMEVVADTTHYHRGGVLGFTVTVTYNEVITVSFQGWSEIETPWGTIISPLPEPIDVVLNPGQTVSGHYGHQIPYDTPFGGPYIYTVMIGTYPDEIWAEDSFEFFIVPGMENREQRYRDWEVIEGGKW
jgi:predicted outer membrane repeat protein